MPGTPATTSRLAIPRYANADNVDFAGQVNAISDMIDSKVARLSDYIIDLMANRPAASIAKRRFYATDLGLEFIDTGTAWVPVGIPIGGGFTWYGATDPTAELVLADGRALSRTTYAALYTKLGGASSPYGQGNGSTTFNLPNTVGKVTVHPDGSITRGATGGAKTHTLSTGEMPSHNHSVNDPGHAHGVALYANGGGNIGAPYWAPAGYNSQVEGPQAGYTYGGSTGISINNAGSGGEHNNMQPYLGAPQAIRIL